MKDSKLLRPILAALILAVAGLLGSYVIFPIWAEKAKVEDQVVEAENRNQIQLTKLRKLERDSGNIEGFRRQLAELELSIPADDNFEEFIAEIIAAIGDSIRLEAFSTTANDGSGTGVILDNNAIPQGFSLTILIKDSESSTAMLEKLQNINRTFLFEKVGVNTAEGTGQVRLVIEGVIFSTP